VGGQAEKEQEETADLQNDAAEEGNFP